MNSYRYSERSRISTCTHCVLHLQTVSLFYFPTSLRIP